MAGDEKQELISVRKAAQECGRNAETVRRWIWSGRLPAEKLGNQLFIKRNDLENYCRDTSVAYRAEPAKVFSEVIDEDTSELTRVERGHMGIKREGGSEYVTGGKPVSRAELIGQLRLFRLEIKAKLGMLDAAGVLENVRSGRMDELPGLH